MSLSSLRPSPPQANPGNGSNSLHASVARTAQEFERLSEEWTELLTRSGSGNVFLSFDWMYEWWIRWGKRRELFLITVRTAAGRLVGLAPLSIASSPFGPLGHTSIRFLADEHVGSDYLDLLSDPEFADGVAQAGARVLLEHHNEWDYIRLHDANNSPVLAWIRGALNNAGLIERCSPASTCLYISLPDSVEAYASQMGSKLRGNVRRRVKKLESVGELRFVACSESGAIQQRFPEMIELHRKRFLGESIKSAFLKPGVPDFHRAALSRLAERNLARLFLLEVNGTPVAALYGFALTGVFSFYQFGMDPEWRQYGAGQVLISRAIDEAIRAGYREFDFLRGAEAYKFDWADQQRQTTNFLLYNPRIKGHQARLAHAIERGIRSVARTFRRSVRSLANGGDSERDKKSGARDRE